MVVNGKGLIGYCDTVSSMSFVKAHLFPTLKRTGTNSIYGINDRQAVKVPTASVKITSPIFDNSEEAMVEVGLLPHMKWSVLLGNDVFENNGLRDILQVHNKALINPDSNDAHATQSDQTDNDCADGTPDVRNFQSGRDVSQTPTVGDVTNSLRLALFKEMINDATQQPGNLVGDDGNRPLQRSNGSDIITVTFSDNVQTGVTGHSR